MPELGGGWPTAGWAAKSVDQPIGSGGEQVLVALLMHAPRRVVVAGLCRAFGAGLRVTTIEDRIEVEVVRVLECSGLFEAPMPPLLHGPTPSGDGVRRCSVAPRCPFAALTCSYAPPTLVRTFGVFRCRTPAQASGSPDRVSSRSSPPPVEGQRRLAVDQPPDGLAHQLGPPSLGQPGVGVAPQEGLDVGPGAEQAGVDLEVAAELADPGRHQRRPPGAARARARAPLARGGPLGGASAASATAARISAAWGPRRWRSSSPRTWRSCSSDFG